MHPAQFKPLQHKSKANASARQNTPPSPLPASSLRKKRPHANISTVDAKDRSPKGEEEKREGSSDSADSKRAATFGQSLTKVVPGFPLLTAYPATPSMIDSLKKNLNDRSTLAALIRRSLPDTSELSKLISSSAPIIAALEHLTSEMRTSVREFILAVQQKTATGVASNTMKFWTWALDVASEQSPEDGRDMFDVLLKKCPMTLDDLVDCGIMSFTSVAVRSVHRYRFIMECIDLNNTELWQKLARLVSSKVIRLPAVHTWPAPTNINEALKHYMMRSDTQIIRVNMLRAAGHYLVGKLKECYQINKLGGKSPDAEAEDEAKVDGEDQVWWNGVVKPRMDLISTIVFTFEPVSLDIQQFDAPFYMFGGQRLSMHRMKAGDKTGADRTEDEDRIFEMVIAEAKGEASLPIRSIIDSGYGDALELYLCGWIHAICECTRLPFFIEWTTRLVKPESYVRLPYNYPVVYFNHLH